MRKIHSIAMPALAALLMFWVAGFIGFNVHIKSIHGPAQDKTEAIIVLTGGPDRINTGLDLLEAKKARNLFISGVNTNVSVKQILSMWREGAEQAPCCIVLGHEAQNTFENAAEARDWIRINHIDSAWILTADYHMPRAWLEFSALLPDIDLQPYPVGAGRANLLLTAREYNKTILTWLRLKTMESRA